MLLSLLKKYIPVFTIRFTVVGIFIFATFLTGFVATSLQYHFSKKSATESAERIFEITSQSTNDYLTALDQKATNIVRLLAQFSRLADQASMDRETIELFAEAMKANKMFYAVYIGFANGDFYELVNLESSPVIRKQIQAQPSDRWVLVTVKGEGEQRQRAFSYFDEQAVMRDKRVEASDYDVRTRPWFIRAKVDGVYKTNPYLFEHLQAPGQTYSTVISSTKAVIAVDIALSSLSEFLLSHNKSTSTSDLQEMFLYQKSGEIVASNQQQQVEETIFKPAPLQLSQKQQQLIEQTPVLRISNERDWAPIDFSNAGKPGGYSVEVLNYIAQQTGLRFEFINGFSWPELIAKFKKKDLNMLQPIFLSEENQQWGLSSKSFLTLPFSVVTQLEMPVIHKLSDLNGKSIAIPKGWAVIKALEHNFPDITIVEVNSTQAVLEAVKNGNAYAGLDNDAILRFTQQRFYIKDLQYHQEIDFSPAKISTTMHFMLDDEQGELMDIINLAIANIPANYREYLDRKWLKGSDFNHGVVPYPELIELAKSPENYGQLLTLTIDDQERFIYMMPVNSLNQEFLAIVIPSSEVLSASVEKVKWSIIITAGCLLLILPITWFFAAPIVTPIKLLQAENQKIKFRKYQDVRLVDSHIKEISELANSLVDMSLAIAEHEKNNKELMEAFIKLIAQAIDDKSPYTGGHCNRVPELGIMLANAACGSKQSAFAQFNFANEDEQREFRIAAWLHDCGKIITPEHIVDKGTKLETIYNRIHEVRTRFEVLWRDAEIKYYQQYLLQPENDQQLKQSLAKTQQQLQDDFAFIATSNVGGEFMDNSAVVRLTQIAQTSWQRHFDNTIGLSPVEELQLEQLRSAGKMSITQQLPVTEQLLSDKAEHVIARTRKQEFKPEQGINMEIPEHQYNLGELYNLSIQRGTLTAEDRYKINEHMLSTIKMLDTLPFPPELANVPRYASTHHETLIGTGYPRKLSAKDLSIPERVLVIADIFEALTAGDRPYKKAKSLSQSIDILHKFALNQHIDYDLFELLLTSGTYLAYGQQYLQADQLDEVDISKYLRSNKMAS